MRKIFRSGQNLFLFFSMGMLLCLNALAQVNPQPGQNLWHITAAIGTEVDQLAFTSAACCAATFTAITAVDKDVLTVGSKLDQCCFTLGSKIDALSSGITISAQCDLAGTYTAIAAVDNDVLTVGSKLDQCCLSLNSKSDVLISDMAQVFEDFRETWTILAAVQTDLDQCCFTLNSKIDQLACSNTITGPTIISSPGHYCLAANISISAGNAIVVNANNVVLDLNNNFINGNFTANNGIVVSAGFSNVTIQNGTIIAMASNGILIQGANCKVINCDLIQNNIGVALLAANNNIIRNTFARSSIFAGFSLINSNRNIFNGCAALATSSLNGNAYGFISSAGTVNIFEDCVADEIQTATAARGFEAAGFLLTGTECCSKILDCKADNTTTPSVGFAVPYGIKLQQEFVGTVTPLTKQTGTGSSAVAFSPDGRFFATGLVGNGKAIPGNFQIYSFDGISLESVTANDFPAAGVDWHPNGNYVAVGGATNSTPASIQVYFFNGATLTPIASATHNNSTVIVGAVRVLSVKWSPDGSYLAIGGLVDDTNNANIAVYAFDGNSLTQVASALHGTVAADLNVYSVDWSFDGKHLVIGADADASSNTISVYAFDGSSLTNVADVATGDDFDVTVDFSPNGKYVAFGGDNVGTGVYAFDGSSLVLVGTPQQPGSVPINSVNWSQDGNFLASGVSVTPEVLIYSFDGTKLTLNDAQPHGQPVNSVYWALSENYLGIGGGSTSSSVDVRVYKSLITGTKNCVVKNNVVSCTTGGCHTGIGINACTFNNTVVNNESSNNDRNYLFVSTLASSENAGSQPFDACCFTLNSKSDVLISDMVQVFEDFRETWTILGALQTDLDQCCSTLNSKVDVVNTNIIAQTALINADFAGTFTAIAACCSCNPTPITGSTTLSSPGTYCLAHDISGSISITATDVALDLNGHTISSGGITISGSNVLVKNGRIDTGTGITTSGTLQNITLQDIQIINSTASISVSTVTNLIIERVNVDGSATGITVTDCPICLLQDCQVVGCTATGTGFVINGAAITPQYICINNCVAKFNAGNGFAVQGDITGSYALENCVALGNAGEGFYLTRPFGTVEGCLSSSNGAAMVGNGFRLDAGILLNANNCLVRKSNSTNNAATGFIITTTNCVISECQADNNGIFGFDVSLTGTCVVEKCTAVTNGSGGFNASNFATLYLNSAISNGTTNGDNYINVNHPPSAQITSIGSGIPNYGDNLSQ